MEVVHTSRLIPGFSAPSPRAELETLHEHAPEEATCIPRSVPALVLGVVPVSATLSASPDAPFSSCWAFFMLPPFRAPLLGPVPD